MTSRQPNGDDPAPIREREQEQVAVLLDQREAYTASVALVAQVETQIIFPRGGDDSVVTLGDVRAGGIRSIDAQPSAMGLTRALTTLEAVGWPHQHERRDYVLNISECEASGIGPWGER
jgi:hypothetical protein